MRRANRIFEPLTQVLVLCVLAVLIAYTTLRHTRSRRGSPRFPAKKMRYSGVGTWLLLITVPALLWMVVVAPYAVCFSSPVALVIGVALWLLVSFTMSIRCIFSFTLPIRYISVEPPSSQRSV